MSSTGKSRNGCISILFGVTAINTKNGNNASRSCLWEPGPGAQGRQGGEKGPATAAFLRSPLFFYFLLYVHSTLIKNVREGKK